MDEDFRVKGTLHDLSRAVIPVQFEGLLQAGFGLFTLFKLAGLPMEDASD